MTTPNFELLDETIREIENQDFLWNQNVWIGGDPVTNPADDNACGTACCLAGRVALKSDRLKLYTRSNADQNTYWPSSSFIAKGKEPGSFPADHYNIDKHTGFYYVEGNQFKPVELGMNLIHAEQAAINDLKIREARLQVPIRESGSSYPVSASNMLFDSYNSLEDIVDARDRLKKEIDNENSRGADE